MAMDQRTMIRDIIKLAVTITLAAIAFWFLHEMVRP